MSDPAPRPARWARVDARLADAALAVAVTLVIALVAASDPARAAPLGEILSAAAFGAVLLGRRRAPVLVLVATILLTFGYYIADLPPIGMVLPAVGALYSAAEGRRTGWATGCAVVLIAVASFFRLGGTEPDAALNGYTFVTEVALAAGAIALGVAVRMGGEARERTARIAELTAVEQVHAADARRHAERMQIARDLHDTIGHTLSVASLHAAVASEALDAPDGTRRTDGGDGARSAAVRAALAEVRTATSEALRELRRTVKVLRDDPATDPAPVLGMASVGPVFDAVRAAGLRLETSISLDGAALPRPVDVAAFRILQESLTNVLRHAEATAVEVDAHLEGAALMLTIRDDGAGRAPSAARIAPGIPEAPAAPLGAGLRGMAERAELLGGTLLVEQGPQGFVVTARLPLRTPELP